MLGDEDKGLRERLVSLKQEHRDLDMAISTMVIKPSGSLQMQRMKREKLRLRDEISRIEDELYPDIIA